MEKTFGTDAVRTATIKHVTDLMEDVFNVVHTDFMENYAMQVKPISLKINLICL